MEARPRHTSPPGRTTISSRPLRPRRPTRAHSRMVTAAAATTNMGKGVLRILRRRTARITRNTHRAATAPATIRNNRATARPSTGSRAMAPRSTAGKAATDHLSMAASMAASNTAPLLQATTKHLADILAKALAATAHRSNHTAALLRIAAAVIITKDTAAVAGTRHVGIHERHAMTA